MSDTSGEKCTRCGHNRGEDGIVVSLSGPPAPDLPGELRLCAHCARSLSRWFGDRARRRARVSERLDIEERSPSRRPTAQPFLGLDEVQPRLIGPYVSYGLFTLLVLCGGYAFVTIVLGSPPH